MKNSVEIFQHWIFKCAALGETGSADFWKSDRISNPMMGMRKAFFIFALFLFIILPAFASPSLPLYYVYGASVDANALPDGTIEVSGQYTFSPYAVFDKIVFEIPAEYEVLSADGGCKLYTCVLEIERSSDATLLSISARHVTMAKANGEQMTIEELESTSPTITREWLVEKGFLIENFSPLWSPLSIWVNYTVRDNAMRDEKQTLIYYPLWRNPPFKLYPFSVLPDGTYGDGAGKVFGAPAWVNVSVGAVLGIEGAEETRALVITDKWGPAMAYNNQSEGRLSFYNSYPDSYSVSLVAMFPNSNYHGKSEFMGNGVDALWYAHTGAKTRGMLAADEALRQLEQARAYKRALSSAIFLANIVLIISFIAELLLFMKDKSKFSQPAEAAALFFSFFAFLLIAWNAFGEIVQFGIGGFISNFFDALGGAFMLFIFTLIILPLFVMVAPKSGGKLGSRLVSFSLGMVALIFLYYVYGQHMAIDINWNALFSEPIKEIADASQNPAEWEMQVWSLAAFVLFSLVYAFDLLSRFSGKAGAKGR